MSAHVEEPKHISCKNARTRLPLEVYQSLQVWIKLKFLALLNLALV